MESERFLNEKWSMGDEGLMSPDAAHFFDREKLAGKSVLNVGVGSFDTTLASTVASKFVGIDISRVALTRLRGSMDGNADAVLGNAKSLPFKDGAFDVVLSFDSLTPMGEDAIDVIREMARVTGGLLIFVISHVDAASGAYKVKSRKIEGGTLFEEADISRMCFDEDGLRKLMGSIGFRVTGMVTVTENEMIRMNFTSSECYNSLSPEGDINSRIYVEAVKEYARELK